MFGTNEVVGKKQFSDVSDKLMVTSIFRTLQGEGPYAGQPAAFIRLSKCNLQCAFCDTYFDDGNLMTFDEVIKHTGERGFKCMVITGGEPMLQSIGLLSFLNYQRVKEISGRAAVQMETNGILPFSDRRGYLPYYVHIVMSPKCHETTGRYLKPSEANLKRANTLKFVLSADKNSPYHQVPDWAFDWLDCLNGDLYVSPMAEYKKHPKRPGVPGVIPGNLNERSEAERVSFWEDGLLDKVKMQYNHEYAAEYCMKHGTRLSMQMQLFTSLA